MSHTRLGIVLILLAIWVASLMYIQHLAQVVKAKAQLEEDSVACAISLGISVILLTCCILVIKIH